MMGGAVARALMKAPLQRPLAGKGTAMTELNRLLLGSTSEQSADSTLQTYNAEMPLPLIPD